MTLSNRPPAAPITNVGLKNESFENAVVSEFGLRYGATHPTIVTEALNEVPKIAKGLEELKASVPTSCGDGGY
jgi:hypothetical protein